MKKTKLTIDLTDQNRDILDDLNASQHSSYGNTVNTLINTFCNIPENNKTEIVKFLKQKIKELNRHMDGAGDFDMDAMNRSYNSYMDIAAFLNNSKLTKSEIDESSSFLKIPIKNGYLVCPDDYIIVNPEQAEMCEYAGVVECRNSARYGIPHLLFFSDFQYSREYDSDYQEYIIRLCCQAYPDFSKILDMQVTPIDDPDNPGIQLNAREWMEAPTIGLFSVYVQDDLLYGRNYAPPQGTRIIRISPNN